MRRGTASQWAQANPVLNAGEPGYVLGGSGRMKIGDGSTRWNDLAYFAPKDVTEPATLQEHIDHPTPHPAYDDGPDLTLLYENAKV